MRRITRSPRQRKPSPPRTQQPETDAEYERRIKRLEEEANRTLVPILEKFLQEHFDRQPR